MDYTESVGFQVDVDHRAGDSFRVVQLTSPGSACSIAIGKGLKAGEPGSVNGLQLVVGDIEAARAELVDRRVDAGDVFHFGEAGRPRACTRSARATARSSRSTTRTATSGSCR